MRGDITANSSVKFIDFLTKWPYVYVRGDGNTRQQIELPGVPNVPTYVVKLTFTSWWVWCIRWVAIRRIWASWYVLVHLSTWTGIQAGPNTFQSFVANVGPLLQSGSMCNAGFLYKFNQTYLNYNDRASYHRLDMNKHQLFDEIDGTYVQAILPHHERVHFISCKRIPTQNVLAAL